MKFQIFEFKDNIRIFVDDTYVLSLTNLEEIGGNKSILFYRMKCFRPVEIDRDRINIISNDFQLNLDDFMNIIYFLIDFYCDKGYESLLIGNDGLLDYFSSFRDILKPLGFKIPRRRSDYISYKF